MYRIKFFLPLFLISRSLLAQDKPVTDSFWAMPEVQLQTVEVQSFQQQGLKKDYKKTPDLQQPVDKLLSGIKGVQMIRRGNFAWEPTIRGLSGGQINTTIDGMYVFGACTDKMDPVSSYIEPANLQTIQVGYGPGAAQYGTGIGGGFDFRLMKAMPDTAFYIKGLAGAGWETNGAATKIMGAVQAGNRNWAIGANGVFRKSGNYRMGGGKQVDFSQYTKWNGGLNATHRLGNHHQLSVAYLQDEGYDIGYPALTMDVAYAKAKIGSLSHTYSCGHHRLFRWESKVYYNFVDHAMDDTRRPSDQVPMHMDMPGDSRTAGFFTKALYRLNDKSVFTLLVNGYQNRLHAEMTMYPDQAAEMFMLTIPDAQRNMIGMQLSNQYDLFPFWNMEAGIRMDYVVSGIYTELGRQTLSGMHSGTTDRKQAVLNVFLQHNWRLAPNWELYAGLAKAGRAPTLQELYGFYLYNRMDAFDYLGNSALKQEQSWNVTIGTAYKREKWEVGFNGFSYFFRDYIAGARRADYSVMTIGALGVKQYTNLPGATLYGIELEAGYRPFKGLRVATTQAYTYGRDHEGAALPLISPLRSSYSMAYTYRGFRAEFSMQCQADQHHVSTEKYGERPSVGFTVLNATVGKSFTAGKHKIDLNVSMENIADIRYYEHLDIMKVYRPGQNLILHGTYNF